MKSLATAELYDPVTGRFRLVGDTKAAGGGFTATLLQDGRVLIAGGQSENSAGLNLNSAGLILTGELYDPELRKFVPTGSLKVGRTYHTATLLDNGRVLIAGGTGTISPSELYDPKTRTFQETGRLALKRSEHCAALLNNGTVLISGGLDPDTPDHMRISAELYDPRSGRFRQTGRIVSGSADGTALLLKGGELLIIGGRENWDAAIPEIYDPNIGVFRRAGRRLEGNYACSATLLANGKVLLTGCVHYPTLATPETLLYDPLIHRVTDADNMTVPRCGNSATLLRDGKVLIAGGWATPHGTPKYYASAELYDPARGTFTPTGSMHVARKYPRAVLLHDGTVLILGGESSASGD